MELELEPVVIETVPPLREIGDDLLGIHPLETETLGLLEPGGDELPDRIAHGRDDLPPVVRGGRVRDEPLRLPDVARMDVRCALAKLRFSLGQRTGAEVV